MAEIFDLVAPASFAGISFPYTEYSVDGSLDHHIHKYLHRPGGEVEDLARHAYQFKFKIAAHTSYRGDFADLYPSRVAALISTFETGLTFPLEVPGIGTFQAKAINWTRNVRAAVRSGEMLEWTFLEDSTSQFTTTQLVGFATASMGDDLLVLEQGLIDAGYAPTLLDDLKSAVTTLLNAEGIAELALNQLAIKASIVIGLCELLDPHPFFQSPLNAIAIDSFYAIWGAAVDVALALGLIRLERSPETFITPSVMSVMDLSLELYKDNLHVGDLLNMNAINRPSAVPAGSFIRYVPPV